MKKLMTLLVMLGLTLPHLAYGMEQDINDELYIPNEIKKIIFENFADNNNPQEVSKLRLVCMEWRTIIDGGNLPIQGETFKYSDLCDNSIWKECVHAWYGVTGHGDILNQFLNGKLVYKPNKDNDEGRIEFKISDLRNPFACAFDLSECGVTGKYISIRTGFRKKKIAGNKDKVEVWIAPRFLIDKFSRTTAKHFEPILGNWDGEKAPIALFYTWGNWDNLSWYDYLTDKAPSHVSSKNLYENWRTTHPSLSYRPIQCFNCRQTISSFIFELK